MAHIVYDKILANGLIRGVVTKKENTSYKCDLYDTDTNKIFLSTIKDYAFLEEAVEEIEYAANVLYKVYLYELQCEKLN